MDNENKTSKTYVIPGPFKETLKSLIEAQMKPESLKQDLFFALLLLVMKENGFLLLKRIGGVVISIVDFILAKRREDKISETVLIFKQYPDLPIKIIFCRITDAVLVIATVPGIPESTFSVCLDINKYMVTSELGVPSNINYFSELNEHFKDKVVTPVKCVILNNFNAPSGNLQGLPEDVLHEIMLYLPVKNAINMSKVCKRLYSVVNNDRFWYRIYKRDFGGDNIFCDEFWLTVYKEKYLDILKEEYSYSLVNEYEIREEVSEVSAFARHLQVHGTDSRWQMIL